jgi:hypothetical protein
VENLPSQRFHEPPAKVGLEKVQEVLLEAVEGKVVLFDWPKTDLLGERLL